LKILDQNNNGQVLAMKVEGEEMMLAY